MQKIIAVFVAKPVSKTNFYCIFGNEKFRSTKKCCFRRISWVFIVHKNIILPSNFCIYPPKTAFFAFKTDFHFNFSDIKNSYAEKNYWFRSQTRYPKPTFQIYEKKSAIFAENMKKVDACRFKKVRFSQSFRAKLKIKNL